jgi:SAM-dependent methyltransferase
MRQFSGPCPVCGGEKFSQVEVLGRALIDQWQLQEREAVYINRQQGLYCDGCRNNFRAMALAAAIFSEYEFGGTLEQFCDAFRHLKILEINPAANLFSVLGKIPGHILSEYPQVDMMALCFEAGDFDLVIHSDTLEHVSDPIKALTECRRVLKAGGRCIFTVPVVIDRLTRSRTGLPPSYHGDPRSDLMSDLIVHTEFGADVWKNVLQAGFSSCRFFSLEYPAALALIAK